ncbi:hypothetical protein WA026_023083 [Henosepilachna vigintioctopunctata]|uniref:Ku domain-containing protein n=1 Tax=Henosepilachna vigintioctopunctata TaxID=420089 RepID=A0AAW1U7P1_9CUCU
MPPAAKRNHCVVLYDLKCGNQRELRQALFKVYCRYYINNSKNLVNLVLVNSDKTDNRKHAKFGRGYLHIQEINREEQSYDPNFIYDKIEVKSAESMQAANWMEAIRVAIDILAESRVARVITFQILFFTDLNSSSQSEECLERIISDLKQKGIYLYILGPEVLFPQAITSLEETPKLMRGVSFLKANETLQQAKMKLIDGDSKVIIADCKRGLELFFNFRKPNGKQPWLVPLTIGTKISFPVKTSKFTSKICGLKLITKSNQYKESPQYQFTSVEDSTKIYHYDNIRKGISRHGKFIAIENNDLFKSKTERIFSLLFVTSLKGIPEYMLKGPGCYTVIGDSGTSVEAFHCLLRRLELQRMCLVASRVYSKGNKALYFALIPISNKKCFRAVQLPVHSEVPFEWMEQNPKKNDNGVSSEVSDYLDKIVIDSPKFALNCHLTPNVACNIAGRDVLNIAADKLLHEKLHLDQVDYNVFKTSINSEIGGGLRALWPSKLFKESKEVSDYDLDSDHENYF